MEEDPETNEKRIGVGDDCRFELHIAFEARKQKFHCLNKVSCLCSTLVEAQHRHEMVLMQWTLQSASLMLNLSGGGLKT